VGSALQVNKMSRSSEIMIENVFEKLSSNEFVPLTTLEQNEAIKKFYEEHKEMQTNLVRGVGANQFRADEPWIQTYTGKRFTPTNPIVDDIVIEDIAHPLSMQCRFSGHVKKFYSVAQHSVLVSYVCDNQDALWGLLHDASEAYLVDIPRPIKKSGKFDNYLEFENIMQRAICKKFGLQPDMPESVRMADDMLLATEARDLMSPMHKDWINLTDPLPFTITPLSHDDAKLLFLKRFEELTGTPFVFEPCEK